MLTEVLSYVFLLLSIATGVAMVVRFWGSAGAILGAIAFGLWVTVDITRRVLTGLDVEWWNYELAFTLPSLAAKVCLLAAVLTARVNSQPNEMRMTKISCPKCNALAVRGGVPAWQIIVAICFFPIGLLALLGGRKPTQCPQCTYIWQA